MGWSSCWKTRATASSFARLGSFRRRLSKTLWGAPDTRDPQRASKRWKPELRRERGSAGNLARHERDRPGGHGGRSGSARHGAGGHEAGRPVALQDGPRDLRPASGYRNLTVESPEQVHLAG